MANILNSQLYFEVIKFHNQVNLKKIFQHYNDNCLCLNKTTFCYLEIPDPKGDARAENV